MFSNSNYFPHSKDGEGNVLNRCVCSQGGRGGGATSPPPPPPRTGQDKGYPSPQPGQKYPSHRSCPWPGQGVPPQASAPRQGILSWPGRSYPPGQDMRVSAATPWVVSLLRSYRRTFLLQNIFVCSFKLIMNPIFSNSSFY